MVSFGAAIGLAVGGLGEGLKYGMDIGNKINTAWKAGEISDIQAEALSGAETERNADMQKLIQQVDNAGTPGFSVNGTAFGTREEAEAAAGKLVNPMWDYLQQGGYATQVRDAYIGQGDIEQAQRWDAFSKSQTTEAAMGSFSSAVTALRSGDWDAAFRNIERGYQAAGAGYKIDSHEMLKDEAGNVIGAKLTITSPDGSQQTHTIDGIEDLTDLALSVTDPKALFDSITASSAAAAGRAADVAEYGAKSDIDTNAAAAEAGIDVQQHAAESAIDTDAAVEEEARKRALPPSQTGGLSSAEKAELEQIESRFAATDMWGKPVLNDPATQAAIRAYWLSKGNQRYADLYGDTTVAAPPAASSGAASGGAAGDQFEAWTLDGPVR